MPDEEAPPPDVDPWSVGIIKWSEPGEGGGG